MKKRRLLEVNNQMKKKKQMVSCALALVLIASLLNPIVAHYDRVEGVYNILMLRIFKFNHSARL